MLTHAIDEVGTVVVEGSCANGFITAKTCHSEVSRGLDSVDLVRRFI
jgi:hypothetical protein